MDGSGVPGPEAAAPAKRPPLFAVESSKESNIDFYARHGFRVTGEFRLLRGPTVWRMWRDPSGW